MTDISFSPPQSQSLPSVLKDNAPVAFPTFARQKKNACSN